MQNRDTAHTTAAGAPPRWAEPTIDEMYAYEPDRESPERLRVFSCVSAAPSGGYLAETRERAQREEAPRRQNS